MDMISPLEKLLSDIKPYSPCEKDLITGNFFIPEEYRDLVLNYVRSTETMEQERPLSIKMLTNAVVLSIKHTVFDPDLPFLRKVIAFCEKGIEKTNASEYKKREVCYLESRLYYHAGFFYDIMFKKTNNRSDIIAAFNYYIASAKYSFNIDVRFWMHRYEDAMSTSHKLSIISKGEEAIKWKKKSFELSKFCAEISVDYDKIQATRCYTNASKFAYDLSLYYKRRSASDSCVTLDAFQQALSWAEQACTTAFAAVNLSGVDPTIYARNVFLSHFMLGISADLLCELRGDDTYRLVAETSIAKCQTYRDIPGVVDPVRAKQLDRLSKK